MTIYRVTAKRWELGWELHIADVGVTQSRTLTTAEKAAREYIALAVDADEDSFDVEITPELNATLQKRALAAREAGRRAERARDEAASLSRRVVRDLKAAGLSGSEVAVVLGVSTQRVSQLVKS